MVTVRIKIDLELDIEVDTDELMDETLRDVISQHIKDYYFQEIVDNTVVIG